jgi:predicted permease
MVRPPRLARALIALVIRGEAREVVLGDLEEDFQHQLETGAPPRVARRRYWRQALGSANALGWDRAAPDSAIDLHTAEHARPVIGGHMLQDVRHGLRLLWRYPAFAVAAIVTLAFGIGANTAVSTVAWHAILKPLPYPNSDRLVTLWEASPKTGETNTVMPANYRDWEREGQSFDVIAAYGYFRATWDLTAQGEPEQWRMRQVTGRYFDVFAMPALIGRTLTPADAARPTVVLSEGAWRRRFAADHGVVGREIRLADRPSLVVGVMPAAFEISGGRVDAWSAFELPPETPGQRLAAHYLGVVGRLTAAISVERADAELRAIAARAAERFPRENGGVSAAVTSMQSERGATARGGLVVLALAAMAVLVIACANLGSLQFSRTAARTREFGIRASLGASRRRLVAQLLTESLVIAAIGGAVGLAFGKWLLAALEVSAPAAIRPAVAAGPDVAVVVFAGALALVSGLAFAVWPAWRASARAASWLNRRVDTGDRRARAIRASLVTLQIALAAMLLVTSATLVASLFKVLDVDPGFERHAVLTFDVSLPQTRLDTFAKREALLDAILTEIKGVPGVTSACAINETPFETQGTMTYVPEGQTRPVNASPRNITAGCLELLRIPLVRGRTFGSREPARAAIVSEAFVRSAWPGADAVGRRVHVGVKEGPLVEIVGVVADTRQTSLENRPHPQLYEVAVEGSAFWPQRILAQTSGRPEPLFPAIRNAVRRVDPNQPVANLRTLEEVVSGTLASRRFDLSLVTSFSAMALLLAAVGIYGLLSQTVAQRTGEIGIRLALGATPRSVVRLVMSTAWTCIVVGAAAGVAGAYAASNVLRRFVFGVSATEPVLYVGVVLTIMAIALFSAWMPARRAARVDPVRTLNQT